MIPESQSDFKKGRSTMDNIYVLNYLVQREKVGNKDGKVYVIRDLKAAFDNVDRVLSGGF